MRSAVAVVLVVVTALLGAVAVMHATPQASSTSSPALGVRGADISFTLQNEDARNVVFDGGESLPIETILANHGANYVRLRVWVAPAPGTSDLASALQLARRARASGLNILLDLHYSDTWADRTSQQTPADWRGQDAKTLRATVERYTRDVLVAFERQGTPPKIVQLGNEITHGMLWPLGKIHGSERERTTEFEQLLRAAVRGAGWDGLDHPPAVMLHIDTGGDADSATRFFDRMVGAGIRFDLIGLSYYPFWHGTLARLGRTLAVLAERYDRDVLIAETSYPWTLAEGDGEPNIVHSADQLPDADAYPPTVAGQHDYFQALRRLLLAVPGGRGAGFLVWEPAWLPGVGVGPGIGNAYDNLTLFDADGRGLPALGAFEAPQSP